MHNLLTNFSWYKLVFFIITGLTVSAAFAQENKNKDSLILKLDYDGDDFHLSKNFDFEDNGFKGIKYSYGIIPRARAEGESLISTAKVSVVPSELSGYGNAIQYTLGPQQKSDKKARIEHYLFVGDFGKTYVSEFSIKLHPDFTAIDFIRFDGGSAWCCLHQWHQSSPESPPISLNIKRGTNNILVTEFHYGTRRGDKIRTAESSEKTVELGTWYHFRYEWRIEPGTDNSYCKIWMSDKRMSDKFIDADLWCDYKGQIGYTLEGKPQSEMEPLSRNIREQQGIYQNTYIDPKAFHAVIYDNVKIYLKK